MTGGTCPICGVDDVCSRREWVAVYDHRRAIREDPRALARKLGEYGLDPRPAETAADLCRNEECFGGDLGGQTTLRRWSR